MVTAKHRPRPRRAGLLLALLAPLGPAAAPAAAQSGDEREQPLEVRSFAIPETSLARALLGRAREHIDSQRWSDAVHTLQTLIEDHRGEVSAGSFSADDGSWSSQHPVHPGASAEATRLLRELPREARDAYAERYGQESEAALARARSAGDRAALAEVARRYPLTRAAREAWWALGDLELELGHFESARATWRRAADATRMAGEELSDGAHRRLSFAFPAELERQRTAGESSQLEAPGGAAATPPGPLAQSWRVTLDEGRTRSPFNPIHNRGEQYNLLPVLAGDSLLVSNSMTLRAFDAWTGRLRWESDEAPGWDAVDRGLVDNTNGQAFSRGDFFEAIDRDSVLIAPAVSGRVAVAPLQIPITHTGTSHYRRIRITTVIPDRRLFAFDMESGRELWNHMPPEGWDGELGSFPERMRVAGPPTLAGSRVLVPCYRLQGRVDYHVACYDLLSGELLWSTGVISGQLPLNMFGRHAQEFSAAPLVVSGETVVALTQLGAVAALDLYTGDILWETLYESIPLPATEHQWQPPRRRQVWNNAAPQITDGVAVATPLDSTDLIAIDVQSGAMVWSLPQEALIARSRSRERWTLFGASPDTLFLCGTSVVSWRAPGGLGGSVPPSERLSSPAFSNGMPTPRAALGTRWIVAPTGARRVVLDRLNLRFEERRLSAAWDDEQHPGNALFVDGALFTLSGKYLTGIFDWSVQEGRFEAALAAAPEDHALAFAYGTMLVDRARDALSAGDNAHALALIARAEREYEPRLELTGHGPRTQAASGLFDALRLEAEVLAREADSAGALRRLARARQLVPGLPELRDTLLETARLHGARGDTEQRLEVLLELERSCGELSMPSTTSLLDLASTDVFAPPAANGMTVGLWVLLERAREYARRGRVADELEVLHAILAEHGDVQSEHESGPGAESATVSERVATVVAERGRELYAPFEARARELLERSIAEQDAVGLDRVVALYPLAEAAAEASAARLEHAWNNGETQVLARLVQERLPQDWDARRAEDADLVALLRLATLLRDAGNPDFEAGLLAALAYEQPDRRPDPEAHATLRELSAAAAQRAAVAPQTLVPSFDATAVTRRLYPGSQELIARVPRRAAEADEAELLVLAQTDRRSTQTLFALSSSDPDERLWSETVPIGRTSPFAGRRYLVLPGALVVAAYEGLTALDPASGEELWSYELDDEGVESLAGDSGVVVASLVSTERGARLLALDARGGVELWSSPIVKGLHVRAVVGPRHALLLPRKKDDVPAEVRDLFSGRVLHGLELARGTGDADLRGAWIEEGRLILPGFPRAGTSAENAPVALQAIDLDSGRTAWSVSAQEGRELDSILRSGRSAYLVLFATALSGSEGGLLEVDLRMGVKRPVAGVRLTAEDTPIGVRRSTVVTLDQPYLYLLHPAPGERESLIRQIHLPYGQLWVHRLPVPTDEVYNAPLPLPAHSEDTVALAYTEQERSRAGRSEPRTSLLLLDRTSGLPRDARVLPDALGRADALKLFGLGEALLVQGRNGLMILSKE